MDDEPGRAALPSPDKLVLFRQCLELRGTRDESGLAFLGQRSGEGVGEADLVAGLAVGGCVRKWAGGRMELDGERGKFAGASRPVCG
jgi:hypothetical protein